MLVQEAGRLFHPAKSLPDLQPRAGDRDDDLVGASSKFLAELALHGGLLPHGHAAQLCKPNISEWAKLSSMVTYLKCHKDVIYRFKYQGSTTEFQVWTDSDHVGHT